MQVQSLGWEEPLEEEMATHSSIQAWRIPWTVQDEALGRYSVSREVPRSILKYKTVLGTLDATAKVP